MHPRGLNPGGTGAGWQTTRPAGGLPGWLPADLAVPESTGVACFFSRLLTLPLVLFPAPLPRRGRISPRPRSQSALPGGKGEIFSFLMQGAAPLASPRLNRRGHRSRGANHAPSGGLVPGGTCRVRRIRQLFQKRARAVAPSIKNREKFWGVWGTLSRVPQRFFLLPSPQPCFYLLIDNKEKKS